ncbi:MAG: sulfatase [Verrucomicrobiota bacterium JB024]|nr:sulfatase [Verrucomicrobiota bacterium JB024]
MKPPPNLIILHCHDLGQHLGCYGRNDSPSAAIDGLAAEGALFRYSFCTSPGCSPSRAALWTGYYPHQTGVFGLTHATFAWSMTGKGTHLARYLGDQGYETLLVGGYHEDDSVDKLGYGRICTRDEGLCFRPVDELAGVCEDYLARRREHRERPFFLSVGIFEPHRPFNYGGATPVDEEVTSIPPYIPQDTPEGIAAAQSEFRALHGAIREVDAAVARILKALEASGEADNTFILFTSDHGLAMPRAKCSLYDPGIEVPLIVKGPGIPAGAVRENLFSNVDAFPTLCELMGLPTPEGLAGKSFAPCLREGTPGPRTEIFAEKTYHRSYDPIRCIRTERYKYIVNFEVNTCYDAGSDILRSPIYCANARKYTSLRPIFELYDLEADPDEFDNLAGRAELAAVEADLRNRLVQWMRETNDELADRPVESPYYRKLRSELFAR